MNHERRGQELRQRAARTKVNMVLRLNPEASVDTLQFLTSIGFYDPQPAGGQKRSGQPKSNFLNSVADREDKKKRKKDQEAIDPADAVPTKYIKLGGATWLSITGQQKLLHSVEPAIFSLSNLRLLAKRSEDARTTNTRLIERVTGLPEEFPLTGKYRR